MSKKQNSSAHAHLKTPRVMIGLLLLVFAVLIVALTFLSPVSEEEISDDIDKEFISYMELYLGLTNVSVKNKTLKDGIWTANLKAVERFGLINVDALMYADNRTIFKLYEAITPPSKPVTVIETGKGSCRFEGLTTIDIYIDPYDRWSRIYNDLTENFTAKFGKSLRIQYRIIPTYSVEAMKEAGNKVNHAFRYLACSKQDPIAFNSVKRCIYEIYQETDEFLNESTVQNCVSDSGLNLVEIKECVGGPGAITELSIDQRFGETYLSEPVTPSSVFDCEYRTFPTFADRVYCYLYPLNSECLN